MDPAFVLASQSPRRAQLLSQLGLSFSQTSADIDETPLHAELPEHFVSRMAREKAEAVIARDNPDVPVLAADTAVVVADKILGKPTDKSDALGMLTMLSGRQHKVLTAVCVATKSKQEQAVVETCVDFARLTQEDMEWYWHSGEPVDKAGSYAIQGLGGQFVTAINGSYSAVVGLPLYQSCQLLARMGICTKTNRKPK